MVFVPRWYQVEAVAAALQFFHGDMEGNGIEICPTGSGKSVIIANICMGLDGHVVVFQPSKEILVQNHAKYTSYGYRASIYSASAGQKYVDKITFVTIGSVYKYPHLFKKARYFIFDECHLINPDEGMYKEFIRANPQAKILGLTASPYRLSSTSDGSMLQFVTRMEPRIFHHVLYCIQNNVLFNEGFLAKLEYFNFNLVDRTMLEMNAKGTDFTDASLRAYYRKVDMPSKTIHYAKFILKKRRNVLIACSLTSEANRVSAGIPGSVVVTGETDKDVRSDIEKKFKAGIIRCVVVIGVWVVGFDYPGLEAVLIAKSTMSLAWYYQFVGRVVRPFKYPDGTSKTGWVVDLGGNIDLFGKVETLLVTKDSRGQHVLKNNGRQLTNVTFTKN